MKKKTASFVLACAIGSLCGCGAVPSMKYYQISAPNSPPAPATAATLPLTLVVAPLRGSPLYQDDRLIYATSSEAMGAYEHQRWAQAPTQMIQDVIVRTLRESGHYRTVEELSGSSRGNFILRGSLYDFKEVSGGTLSARVTLNMDLRDVKTGATVWTHYYTHDEPVAHDDVPSVVAALNRNVHQAVGEISSSLQRYLDEYSATNQPQP
jgi:cholesterol transport system auxiliary component